MSKPPKKDESKDDLDEDKAPESAEGGEGADGLEEDGGKKKFGTKKIILFVAVPLVLLIGGGAGLYFTGMLDKVLHKDSATMEGTEHGEALAEGKAKADCKDSGGGGHGEESSGCDAGVAFLEIPNMLVNLSGPDEQPRYLRLKVQLELSNQKDLTAVKAVMPRVVDQFQTYLRELRIKDLRGSAGIYRLQMELLSRVNAAAYPTEVKDVLFQEILIQ